MNLNEAMTHDDDAVAEMSVHEAADLLARQFDAEHGVEPVADEVEEVGDALPAEEEEADEEAGADEQETEVEEVESLGIEDLAEQLGVSVDDVLGKVKVKIKVDGKETEVNLGELRSGYQREADYTRKTQEVSARRKEIDDGIARLQQFEQLALAELQGNPFAQAEQELQREYQSTNWQELEQVDPYEAAAKGQKLQRRMMELNAAKQQRAQQLAQTAQAIAMARQEHTTKEVERLQGMLGWKPDEIPTKVEEMRSFLQREYKVPDALINSISHAEFGLMVKDLMDFKRQTAAKATAETKQAKRIRKVLKPGVPKAPQAASQAKYDALFKRAKRTQSDEDFAAALAAKMGF